MLSDVLKYFTIPPQSFIYGPSSLVELVANSLVDTGLPATTIRRERFGPV